MESRSPELSRGGTKSHKDILAEQQQMIQEHEKAEARNANRLLFKILGGAAGAVALTVGTLLYVSSQIPKMHPGSREWQKDHAENANAIREGKMGPIDIMTRLVMGNAAFARDKKTEFQHRIRDAENRAATSAELAQIENIFTKD